MNLSPGRLAELVHENVANEAALVCHSTLYTEGLDNAVCRGFYDRYPTLPLRLAAALRLIIEDEPPR